MATLSDTTRRDFLIHMAGLGAVLASPRAVLGSTPLVATAPSVQPTPSAQTTLPTRPIPGTGETLPVVGLGSSKPVLEIPTEGTDPLVAVIRVLVEHGGRVVDTSPRTEEIDAEFGQVLTAPDFRDRLFVSTKINTDGEASGIAQMRQNQRLFGRRTLDLLQVESMRDLDVHWPNVLRWKDSGEARYIGVTVSSSRQHDQFESFMRAEPLDFVQMNYSVMEPGAENRLLPLARDLGMAVLINRPFMNGSYFGRSERTGVARMGIGFRLRELGAVFTQVHPRASRRDVRAHRDDESRAHGRQHPGRLRSPAGRGDEAAHAGAGSELLRWRGS